MSYTRWSSEIKNPIPMALYFEIRRRGGSEGIALERKRRGTVLSDWYIYWDCASGDNKDDQLLAVWHCNDSNTPLIDYPTLRQAYDNDDWPFEILSQKAHMQACVKTWLDMVEEEFKG